MASYSYTKSYLGVWNPITKTFTTTASAGGTFTAVENDGTIDGLTAKGATISVNGIDYVYIGSVGDGIIVKGSGLNYTLFSNDTYNPGTVFGDSEGVLYDETTPYNYTVCFLPGTLITTAEGERAIESLQIGEMITLASGAQKPVKWLGKMTVNLNMFNRHSASPILIKAGALGEGLPRRDLYTSYRHAFTLDGVLVIAGVLVNGTTIVQCSDWPEATVTFYQVEVEGHELMLAEGAASETFGEDGDNRALFDNADEYHALYPDAVAAESMDLGRVIVARQLPRAVRARIAAAAEALGYGKGAVA